MKYGIYLWIRAYDCDGNEKIFDYGYERIDTAIKIIEDAVKKFGDGRVFLKIRAEFDSWSVDVSVSNGYVARNFAVIKVADNGYLVRLTSASVACDFLRFLKECDGNESEFKSFLNVWVGGDGLIDISKYV